MGERGRKKRDPVDTVDNQRGRLLIYKPYLSGRAPPGDKWGSNPRQHDDYATGCSVITT